MSNFLNKPVDLLGEMQPLVLDPVDEVRFQLAVLNEEDKRAITTTKVMFKYRIHSIKN